MEGICQTCGESKVCGRCGTNLAHVHFTTGDPPEWWHVAPRGQRWRRTKAGDIETFEPAASVITRNGRST